MTHAPTDFALVIGVDHYPRWSDGAKNLQGPSNDAKAFRDWLIAPTGGGLSDRHVRLIVSTSEPPAPLQQVIDDALRELRQISQPGSCRRFYFYFGGHGHSPQSSAGRQALCLANWSMTEPRASLDLESYVNTAVGCMGFEEGLFFIDSCRLRLPVPPGKPCELECVDPQFGARHRAILFGADHYGAAFEGEIDQDIRGYFTEALLRILRRGRIELRDLAEQLELLVPELAKPRQQVAVPDLKVSMSRRIYLGPPAPDDPPPPPPQANSDDARALLTVKIQSGLENHTAGNYGEPPSPPHGRVVIFRGDEVAASGMGGYSGELAKGSYVVSVMHGGSVESRPLEFDADKELVIKLPRRFSSAPLSGTVAKHEWLTGPSVEESAWKASAGEQAIFVAHWSKAASSIVPVAGSLSLIGGEGVEIEARELGLTQVPPGTYFLRYRSAEYDLERPEPGDETLLVVPVAAGWDTQIFVADDNGRPGLEKASVLMRPAGSGFDPTDGLLDAYERAVAALVSGAAGPDPDTLDFLLWGKWRNPLFGLAGAYHHVRNMRATPEISCEDLDRLSVVSGNLRRLLGEGSGDVAALEIIRSMLAGEPMPKVSVDGPPLFRFAFDALVQADAEIPMLLSPFADAIAVGLHSGSPWTCWGTYAIRLAAVEIDRAAHDTLKLMYGDDRMSRAAAQRAMLHRLTPHWLVEVARDELEQADRQNRPPELARLVRRAGMPRRMCEAALARAQERVVVM